MACNIPVNNSVLYREMFYAVQYFHVKERCRHVYVVQNTVQQTNPHMYVCIHVKISKYVA